MKKKLFVIFCLVCFVGCSNRTDNGKYIVIEKCNGTPVDFSFLANKVDTIGLTFTNGSYVSMIKDVCFNDSLVYVADFSNSLSVFNMKSGKMIKQIHSLGHGKGEYTEITSISTISHEVFLLDQQSMSIFVYNQYLDFIRIVKIPFPAIDFEAITSGFLFYNMNANSQLHRIVYTDRYGDVKKSYLDMKPLPEHLHMPHFLSKLNDETVYIDDFQSNSIYKWKNGDVKKVFTYKDNCVKNEYERTMGNKCSFVTTDKVVTSFVFNRKKYYNVYEANHNKSTTGIFDITSGRPFSPMSQHADVLVGLYSKEDLVELPNWKPGKFKNDDMIMLLYHF